MVARGVEGGRSANNDHAAREMTPMSRQKVSIPTNRLLNALPDRRRRQFLADCDHVELDFGQVLCEPGQPIRHAYFPLDGFISLVTSVDDSVRLEVGLVGNEGMLGVSLVLGVGVSLEHAVVQGTGTALRISAAAFRRHCKDNAALRDSLHRYIHVLIAQLSQMTACTHYHQIEARLARWLLMTRDRANGDHFHLTHEYLAFMLGVRRVGITQAASALQRRGLVSYKRGDISILDGAGLEKASCGCYGTANNMYEQTMRARA
jgi:CRP-like cAMP-binding protein